MEPRPTLVALLHGPDQPGLVARTAGWIFERGGNILHADQHRDPEAGVFFQRIEWEPGDKVGTGVPPVRSSSRLSHSPDAQGRASLPDEGKSFQTFAASLGMAAEVASSAHRPRVAVLVSKADHCFHDLALRWRAGEFAGELVAVVSNHPDLEATARGYGLAFHQIAVTPETRAAAEGRALALLREQKVELLILARYMQVLSAEFLAAFGRPVINIHHSFLPAFAGSRPYHQAHARGVKLIGATAHYATAELDDGPIIHQDVTRVTHRQGVEDLIRLGRELEKLVLARAVRWHLESRVLVYGRKTVVFD